MAQATAKRHACNSPIAFILILSVCCFATTAPAQRQMEYLGRGVVAVNQGDGKVYIGWRLLGDDPDDIRFNVYRAVADDAPVKLNAEPLSSSTNFVAAGVKLDRPTRYFVRPVLAGKEQAPSQPFTLAANAPVRHIAIQSNSAIVFNVTQGPLAPAADLLVTSAINQFTGNTGGITKSGNGVMTLTASQAYTGTTTVQAGTLNLNGASNTSGPVAVSGGTLNLNGATANTGTTLALSGGVTNVSQNASPFHLQHL